MKILILTFLATMVTALTNAQTNTVPRTNQTARASVPASRKPVDPFANDVIILQIDKRNAALEAQVKPLREKIKATTELLQAKRRTKVDVSSETAALKDLETSLAPLVKEQGENMNARRVRIATLKLQQIK